MEDIFNVIFSDRFIPYGFCFMWRPELVWMHVLADLTIALSCFAIPVTIMILVAKRKKTLPYKWAFHMFAAFIFLCGATHVLELIGVWHPIYYFEGIIKVLTAAVSLATAILIFPLVPILLERFSGLEEDENGQSEDSNEDKR